MRYVVTVHFYLEADSVDEAEREIDRRLSDYDAGMFSIVDVEQD